MTTELEDKVEWCINKIMQIEKQLEQLKPKPSKSWYTSFGVWIAVLLTAVTLILVYFFYLSEQGWTMLLPVWMK